MILLRSPEQSAVRDWSQRLDSDRRRVLHLVLDDLPLGRSGFAPTDSADAASIDRRDVNLWRARQGLRWGEVAGLERKLAVRSDRNSLAVDAPDVGTADLLRVHVRDELSAHTLPSRFETHPRALRSSRENLGFPGLHIQGREFPWHLPDRRVDPGWVDRNLIRVRVGLAIMAHVADHPRSQLDGIDLDDRWKRVALSTHVQHPVGSARGGVDNLVRARRG